MYFAMAVTLPSAASLGASGACIVHNDKTKAAEAFVFPPIAAPGTVGGQPFIVPSGVRAITLMHVRHGSAALGGDGGAGRTAGAVRRAGIARSVRAICRRRRGAGAIARRVASSAAAHGRRQHADPARACRHPGRDPPARRRRLLPGSARAHDVRADLADGRQPAGRSAACRGAAGRARRPTRELWHRRRVYVAPAPAAGASALAGWKGQAPSRTDACRFRRLRGPRCRRRQGGRGGLHPVDGPDLRRARCRARRRRAAGRAVAAMPARSAR